MIQNLVLIRHAKAENASASQSDFSRNLTLLGIEHLITQAKNWKNQFPDFSPDIILSSSANRTTQTTTHLCAALHFDFSKTLFKKSLYHADVFDYINELKAVENFKNVILVGHNPTISDLIRHITQSNINELKTSEIYFLKRSHVNSFQFSILKSLLRSNFE